MFLRSSHFVFLNRPRWSNKRSVDSTTHRYRIPPFFPRSLWSHRDPRILGHNPGQFRRAHHRLSLVPSDRTSYFPECLSAICGIPVTTCWTLFFGERRSVQLLRAGAREVEGHTYNAQRSAHNDAQNLSLNHPPHRPYQTTEPYLRCALSRGAGTEAEESH